MQQLGLEFLRLYDGKFNYREGHTVSIPRGSSLTEVIARRLVCFAVSEENLVFDH